MANIEKPIKVEAEVQWAFFNKKNEMSGKFQVDLTNLSDNAVKALQDAGLEPRNREDKPEKGWFITAKSNYEIKPVTSPVTRLPILSATVQKQLR